MSGISQLVKIRSGKILRAIWIIISVILIGFAIVGHLKNQLVEYIFLSFFPAAILANISIAIFYKKEIDNFQLIKTGWSLLCISIFLFSLIASDLQKSGSYFVAGIFIIYPMLVLSFPSGFLVVYIYGGLSYLVDSLGIPSLLNFGKMYFYIISFILWLGFFIFGYLQWFKLLPLLIDKWWNKRSR